jgi:hypothetical protein
VDKKIRNSARASTPMMWTAGVLLEPFRPNKFPG